MANRRFTQFFYTPHAMPVLIDCNFAVGATGAVGTLKGPGVSSVTRLSIGKYQVKLQDNYFKFYGMYPTLSAGVTGADITAGSFVVGTTYIITALGTTNWQTAGLPAGLTAAVGMSFKAAVVGTGTGTVKAVGTTGVATVEVIGDANLMLGPIGSGIQGGYITVQCLDAAGALVDPTSGCIVGLAMYLSNSSVVVQGE